MGTPRDTLNLLRERTIRDLRTAADTLERSEGTETEVEALWNASIELGLLAKLCANGVRLFRLQQDIWDRD